MMIKHYLMIKFKEGQDNIAKEMTDEFKVMEDSMDFIREISCIENCYDRKDNSDLLVVITFDKTDDIAKYINHELHQKFIRNYQDKIETKTTIDQLLS